MFQVHQQPQGTPGGQASRLQLRQQRCFHSGVSAMCAPECGPAAQMLALRKAVSAGPCEPAESCCCCAYLQVHGAWTWRLRHLVLMLLCQSSLSKGRCSTLAYWQATWCWLPLHGSRIAEGP